MNRLFSVLFALIFIPYGINAQFAGLSVEKNFNSRSLSELIVYMEAEHNLKFFYLKKWTDSIDVVQRDTPIKFETIMSETLKNSKLSYFVENNRNIIISYQYQIESDLPPSLVNRDQITVQKLPVMKESSFIRNKKDSVLSPKTQNDLVTIGIRTDNSVSSKATISGVILEKETGQPITGAQVYINDLNIGAVSDAYGYYILSVPTGKHDLFLKYLGRKEQELAILVNGNGSLDLLMEERILELRGVLITADKGLNVSGMQLGLDKINNEVLKQVSSTLGEGDLIKTALLLPGVQTVGEGSSGINVRGGSTDQNLILLDGAPIFNSSHMFGFFSVFNPDVIKEFTLYKSAIPVQYGGRLSSVLDVSIKNGNLKKLSVSGGISPVAGRLCIEGPIVKNRASFLISGRSSYSDWVLRRTDIPALKNSAASFLDLTAKINYNINEKNQFTISGYYSQDHFKFNSDTLYNYKNLTGSINLKHTFSKKMYGVFSGIYSRFAYTVNSKKRIPYAFDLKYDIDYVEGMADLKWFLNSNHNLNFGLSIDKYIISPGTMSPIGSESLILPKKLATEKAIETGLYLSDEYKITDALSLNYGVRYSVFFAFGPSLVYKYIGDAPRSVQTRIDSIYYPKNSISETEGSPEFRFSARYKTGALSSIKLSYTDTYQHLQMISNTTAISPTDIWKLSGPNLKGQKSRQISAGFYKDFKSNALESSVEVYFKTSKNVLEYRGGAELIMNPDLEVDLLNGTGRAYGIEFLFKKKYGALNGWISYTYSRSLTKVDSKYLIDQINQGNYFPSNYDKPHDLKIVTNYKFSRIYSISNTVTFSTGRPITYPVGKYQFRDRELLNYSNRNEYRIPDYFRWDISLNIEGKLRVNKRVHDYLSISVYNLTGRDNAYSIFFVSDPAKNVKGYKLSIFSQPIFSVTYDFRF